jgi:hypothetical protein
MEFLLAMDFFASLFSHSASKSDAPITANSLYEPNTFLTKCITSITVLVSEIFLTYSVLFQFDIKIL